MRTSSHYTAQNWYEVQYPTDSLVTPPVGEPVSVADVKRQIQMPTLDPGQEEHIQDLIVAAREVVEVRNRLALMTQTRLLSAERFPNHAEEFWWRGFHGPVQSVSAIVYDDLGGTEQTVNSTVYLLDDKARFPRVGLQYQQYWPTDARQVANACRLTYVAGYGSNADDVPMRIRRAIIMLVHRAWELGVPCCECPELDQLIFMDSLDVYER